MSQKHLCGGSVERGAESLRPNEEQHCHQDGFVREGPMLFDCGAVRALSRKRREQQFEKEFGRAWSAKKAAVCTSTQDVDTRTLGSMGRVKRQRKERLGRAWWPIGNLGKAWTDDHAKWPLSHHCGDMEGKTGQVWS